MPSEPAAALIGLRGACPLLQVYDMPTSVRFYRDQLGFEIISTSPVLGTDKFHWCLLRNGEAEIMLNTAFEFDSERPVPPESARTRAHDDICIYLGCPDVDTAYAQLRAKGVTVQPPKIAPYGMKQMYLKDPDGFGLCYQWPANPEPQA